MHFKNAKGPYSQISLKGKTRRPLFGRVRGSSPASKWCRFDTRLPLLKQRRMEVSISVRILTKKITLFILTLKTSLFSLYSPISPSRPTHHLSSFSKAFRRCEFPSFVANRRAWRSGKKSLSFIFFSTKNLISELQELWIWTAEDQ